MYFYFIMYLIMLHYLFSAKAWFWPYLRKHHKVVGNFARFCLVNISNQSNKLCQSSNNNIWNISFWGMDTIIEKIQSFIFSSFLKIILSPHFQFLMFLIYFYFCVINTDTCVVLCFSHGFATCVLFCFSPPLAIGDDERRRPPERNYFRGIVTPPLQSCCLPTALTNQLSRFPIGFMTHS